LKHHERKVRKKKKDTKTTRKDGRRTPTKEGKDGGAHLRSVGKWD